MTCLRLRLLGCLLAEVRVLRLRGILDVAEDGEFMGEFRVFRWV
jgi:hypothetical protein